jgi:hypothetical protein
MTNLSNTQQLILSAASQHEMGLAIAPAALPTAARNEVFRSMLTSGLLEERPATFEYRDLGWRQDDEGVWIALRITEGGLRAIGIVPEIGTEAPRSDYPAHPHPLMPTAGGDLDPSGRHAGRRRPHDAGLRGHGTEGAGAHPGADPGSAGCGMGA